MFTFTDFVDVYVHSQGGRLCLPANIGRLLAVDRRVDREAGGGLHAFAEGGFEWDVGLHYVGEVGAPGLHFAVLDQLGRGQIAWRPLRPHYDVAYIPRSRAQGCAGEWDKSPT